MSKTPKTPKTPKKAKAHPISPAARRRTQTRPGPQAPEIPSAFKESTETVTRGALAKALLHDLSEAKEEAPPKEIPWWKDIETLKKKCPTFGMTVGKRQGYKESIKEIESLVKDLDGQIGAALDLHLPEGLKSVRVDDYGVTRVEGGTQRNLDKEQLIIELLNRGVDIETIKEAMMAAQKEIKRSAHVQIRRLAKDEEKA